MKSFFHDFNRNSRIQTSGVQKKVVDFKIFESLILYWYLKNISYKDFKLFSVNFEGKFRFKFQKSRPVTLPGYFDSANLGT